MDSLNNYRAIIKRIFDEYASIPYAHDDLQREVVLDETGNVRTRSLPSPELI